MSRNELWLSSLKLLCSHFISIHIFWRSPLQWLNDVPFESALHQVEDTLGRFWNNFWLSWSFFKRNCNLSLRWRWVRNDPVVDRTGTSNQSIGHFISVTVSQSVSQSASQSVVSKQLMNQWATPSLPLVPVWTYVRTYVRTESKHAFPESRQTLSSTCNARLITRLLGRLSWSRANGIPG